MHPIFPILILFCLISSRVCQLELDQDVKCPRAFYRNLKDEKSPSSNPDKICCQECPNPTLNPSPSTRTFCDCADGYTLSDPNDPNSKCIEQSFETVTPTSFAWTSAGILFAIFVVIVIFWRPPPTPYFVGREKLPFSSLSTPEIQHSLLVRLFSACPKVKDTDSTADIMKNSKEFQENPYLLKTPEAGNLFHIMIQTMYLFFFVPESRTVEFISDYLTIAETAAAHAFLTRFNFLPGMVSKLDYYSILNHFTALFDFLHISALIISLNIQWGPIMTINSPSFMRFLFLFYPGTVLWQVAFWFFGALVLIQFFLIYSPQIKLYYIEKIQYRNSPNLVSDLSRRLVAQALQRGKSIASTINMIFGIPILVSLLSVFQCSTFQVNKNFDISKPMVLSSIDYNSYTISEYAMECESASHFTYIVFSAIFLTVQFFLHFSNQYYLAVSSTKIVIAHWFVHLMTVSRFILVYLFVFLPTPVGAHNSLFVAIKLVLTIIFLSIVTFVMIKRNPCSKHPVIAQIRIWTYSGFWFFVICLLFSWIVSNRSDDTISSILLIFLPIIVFFGFIYVRGAQYRYRNYQFTKAFDSSNKMNSSGSFSNSATELTVNLTNRTNPDDPNDDSLELAMFPTTSLPSGDASSSAQSLEEEFIIDPASQVKPTQQPSPSSGLDRPHRPQNVPQLQLPLTHHSKSSGISMGVVQPPKPKPPTGAHRRKKTRSRDFGISIPGTSSTPSTSLLGMLSFLFLIPCVVPNCLPGEYWNGVTYTCDNCNLANVTGAFNIYSANVTSCTWYPLDCAIENMYVVVTPTEALCTPCAESPLNATADIGRFATDGLINYASCSWKTELKCPSGYYAHSSVDPGTGLSFTDCSSCPTPSFNNEPNLRTICKCGTGFTPKAGNCTPASLSASSITWNTAAFVTFIIFLGIVGLYSWKKHTSSFDVRVKILTFCTWKTIWPKLYKFATIPIEFQSSHKHIGKNFDTLCELISFFFSAQTDETELGHQISEISKCDHLSPDEAISVLSRLAKSPFLPGASRSWQPNDILVFMDVFVEFAQYLAFIFLVPIPWTTPFGLFGEFFAFSLLVIKGSWYLLYWLSFLCSFLWFVFWIINRYDIKERITPETTFQRLLYDFCDVDITIMPVLGTIFSTPILLHLLAPLRCLQYGDSTSGVQIVPESFDNDLSYIPDSALVCWTTDHYFYLVCSVLGILIYVPTVLHSRPLWQYLGKTQIIFNDRFLILMLINRFMLCSIHAFFASTSAYEPIEQAVTNLSIITILIFLVFLVNWYTDPCRTHKTINSLRFYFLLACLWTAISGFLAMEINDGSNPGSGILLLCGYCLILYRVYKKHSNSRKSNAILEFYSNISLDDTKTSRKSMDGRPSGAMTHRHSRSSSDFGTLLGTLSNVQRTSIADNLLAQVGNGNGNIDGDDGGKESEDHNDPDLAPIDITTDLMDDIYTGDSTSIDHPTDSGVHLFPRQDVNITNASYKMEMDEDILATLDPDEDDINVATTTTTNLETQPQAFEGLD